MNTEQEALAIELEFEPQPVPIFMLGESHCLAFTDRIFHEPAYLQERFQTRTIYLPGISSHDFSANNMQRVVNALWDNVLIIGDARGRSGALEAAHASVTPLRIPNVHSKKPRGVPILVVFAGEIALRSLFLRQLGTNDFQLPFEVPGLEVLPMSEGYQQVPFQLVQQLANQVLGPLFTGLKSLYDMGFTSLYLHAVPPPTVSDEEFEKINGFFSPARLRYKAAILFNRLFHSFAESSHVRVIDIWDEVTIRNVLNPEFHIDGTHLNTNAVSLTLGKLMASVIQDERVAIHGRYVYAQQEAQSTAGAELDAEFAASGLRMASIGAASAAGLARGLVFDRDTANQHVRLDWTGCSPRPWSPAIRTAIPGAEFLKRLYDLLYEPELSRLLRSCTGSDYAVLSARPLRFGAQPATAERLSGAESLHTDGCPVGVLRAVLYLSDAAEGLEFQAGEELTAAAGPAGTLVVFDGNRLPHRWSPGRGKDVDVIDLVLAPRHCRLDRCVIWPGMNRWPVDPFNFSMEGFKSHPAGLPFRFIEDSAPWWRTI